MHQHTNRGGHSSDSLPSDISYSEFVPFDLEKLGLTTVPTAKKRIRRQSKALKLKKGAKIQLDHVRGRKCLFVDVFGNPISVLTAGHPLEPKRPSRYASLEDVLGIGELANTIYTHWANSQVQRIDIVNVNPSSLARKCILPPDSSFLRACQKFKTEATAIYADKISTCEGILFDSTTSLYDFLSNATREEVQGLKGAWINYESNVIDLENPDDPQNAGVFEHLDGSWILSSFVQIDIGPRYAFDAFSLLKSMCPNLDTVVIHRKLFGAPLELNYPGVWALRGLRRLQRFRFEGSPHQYRALQKIVRKEVMRKRDRKAEEEEGAKGMRLKTRDSEKRRRETGDPLYTAGVPTLVRWHDVGL